MDLENITEGLEKTDSILFNSVDMWTDVMKAEGFNDYGTNTKDAHGHYKGIELYSSSLVARGSYIVMSPEAMKRFKQNRENNKLNLAELENIWQSTTRKHLKSLQESL